MKNKRNFDKILSVFTKDLNFASLQENSKDVGSENMKNLRRAVVGAEKYEFLHVIYSKTYGDLYNNMSENVKDRYFNKLFHYITKIDLTDTESLVKITQELTSKSIKQNLNKLLFYFQELEEYEKCAALKKVIDSTKKS